MRRYWYPVLLVAGAVACDQGATEAGPQVASLTLTPDGGRVGVGQELTLSASVQGPTREPLANVRVEWQSLNPAAASVTPEGVVRGVAPGVAQVV
ncbi:MAG TPA: Ig-like domain-containing protein, partial [Longimicrobium sp.]